MPESRRCKLVTQNEMSSKSTVLPLAHASLPGKKETSFPRITSDDLQLTWKPSPPCTARHSESHTPSVQPSISWGPSLGMRASPSSKTKVALRPGIASGALQENAPERCRLCAGAALFQARRGNAPGAEVTAQSQRQHLARQGGNAVTQLSTVTEDRTGDTAAAWSISVDKPRHPGGRLFGNSFDHAPQPTLVPEQSAAVLTLDAGIRDEATGEDLR